MTENTYQLLLGNALEVMNDIPSNFIDFVLTSPPYEDLRKYNNSKNMVDVNYVDFIINISKEIYRALKPGGSFILNIQSKVNAKTNERSLSVHKILIRLVEEIGFIYVEPYIWAKTSSIPYQSTYRCHNAFEFCFWLAKPPIKSMIFNRDRIRKPYEESTIKRYQYTTKSNFGNPNEFGNRIYKKDEDKRKKAKINPLGALHSNVILLPQCAGLNKNHPAKMQPKLAEFFIKAGTNENFVVLDPFAGSGTTLIEALNLKCNVIGIDISELYLQQIDNDISYKYLKRSIIESKYNFV